MKRKDEAEATKKFNFSMFLLCQLDPISGLHALLVYFIKSKELGINPNGLNFPL